MRYTVEDLASSINHDMNSDKHGERYFGYKLLEDSLNVFCNPAFFNLSLLNDYPLSCLVSLKRRKRDELIGNKARTNKSNCWIMKTGALLVYNTLTGKNERI